MKKAAAVLAGLALTLAAACGESEADRGGSGGGRETVRGVVLEVEGGLTSVDSFVLRTDEGEVLEVIPAPDGDFRFPLPHLHDHLRTSEPILVELDRSTDPPRAAAIQDAESPARHTGGEEDAAPAAAAPEPAEEGPLEPARPDSIGTGDAEEAGGEEGDRPPDPAPAAADGANGTAAARPPESEEPEEASEAAGPVIELEVIDGRLEGGARREAVSLGDAVTLRVSGNSRDEVHIHGYDLFVRLEDGAGELVFDASIPGVFEVELEGSHTLLIRLEVS